MIQKKQNPGLSVSHETTLNQSSEKQDEQIGVMLSRLSGLMQTLCAYSLLLQQSQAEDAQYNLATPEMEERLSSDLLETATHITNLCDLLRTSTSTFADSRMILQTVMQVSLDDPTSGWPVGVHFEVVK